MVHSLSLSRFYQNPMFLCLFLIPCEKQIAFTSQNTSVSFVIPRWAFQTLLSDFIQGFVYLILSLAIELTCREEILGILMNYRSSKLTLDCDPTLESFLSNRLKVYFLPYSKHFQPTFSFKMLSFDV